MKPRFRLSKKSTIVRLTIPLAIAFSSACAGLPQRAATGPGCPPASMRICEAFGPQSRCHCTDVHALDRELGRLGLTASPATTGR
jgi:hypothetical protein